jgi:hypothetical protein
MWLFETIKVRRQQAAPLRFSRGGRDVVAVDFALSWLCSPTLQRQHTLARAVRAFLDTLRKSLSSEDLFYMDVQVGYPHLNRRALSPTGSESADYERMAFGLSSAQGEVRGKSALLFVFSFFRARSTLCLPIARAQRSPAAHAARILKVELEIRREPLRTPRPPGPLPPRSSYLDSSTHRPFSKRLDRICSRKKIIHEPEQNC